MREQLARERFNRDRNEVLGSVFRTDTFGQGVLDPSAVTWETAPDELRNHYLNDAEG